MTGPEYRGTTTGHGITGASGGGGSGGGNIGGCCGIAAAMLKPF